MSILENETRRAIVLALRDGELSAGSIAERLDRSRPGVSHHLAMLTNAGLIAMRSEGTFRYYRLVLERLPAVWDDYLSRYPSRFARGEA